MAVDTKRVTGRRTLRFESVEALRAEAERLAAGPHRTLGNYTLGQILAHLAQVMEYSLDGFPPIRLPWLMRKAGPLMKGRILRKGFPAGIKPLRGMGDAFKAPEATTEEGLARLRTAMGRLQTQAERHPSPLFGNLSRAEWDQFHCRHAELHLSFVEPA